MVLAWVNYQILPAVLPAVAQGPRTKLLATPDQQRGLLGPIDLYEAQGWPRGPLYMRAVRPGPRASVMGWWIYWRTVLMGE